MKILIVDDHPVFREGVAALFKHAVSGAVVLQAADVPDALRLVADHSDLEIVLLDLMIPGTDGLSALAQLISTRKDLPIMILSASEALGDVREALSLGALGYVPKSASPKVLLAAVELVMNGEIYIPPIVMAAIKEKGNGRSGALKGALTERQIEILKLVASGLQNKEIASMLDLSDKTVKAHITSIFKALNVINRSEAVAVGRDAGLL